MASSEQLNEMLRRFAATMIQGFDSTDVLYEFCRHAAGILDAAGAGVSVGIDDQLNFVTATSETVIDIERAQETGQQGPCMEAYTTGSVITVSNIGELDTWPLYKAAAERCGYRSVVGIPLAIGEHRVGSLNVYDTNERTWSDADLDAAMVLADIATAYLVRAGELEHSRRLADQLQQALNSRIIIEQAKGMLARDHDTTVDEAFELLRRHARNRNVAVRDIAKAVVELGVQLPPT